MATSEPVIDLFRGLSNSRKDFWLRAPTVLTMEEENIFLQLFNDNSVVTEPQVVVTLEPFYRYASTERDEGLLVSGGSLSGCCGFGAGACMGWQKIVEVHGKKFALQVLTHIVFTSGEGQERGATFDNSELVNLWQFALGRVEGLIKAYPAMRRMAYRANGGGRRTPDHFTPLLEISWLFSRTRHKPTSTGAISLRCGSSIFRYTNVPFQKKPGFYQKLLRRGVTVLGELEPTEL